MNQDDQNEVEGPVSEATLRARALWTELCRLQAVMERNPESDNYHPAQEIEKALKSAEDREAGQVSKHVGILLKHRGQVLGFLDEALAKLGPGKVYDLVDHARDRMRTAGLNPLFHLAEKQ